MNADLDARRCRRGRDPDRGVRTAAGWLAWMLAASSLPAAAQNAEVLAVENIVQVARSGGAAGADIGLAINRDRGEVVVVERDEIVAVIG